MKTHILILFTLPFFLIAEQAVKNEKDPPFRIQVDCVLTKDLHHVTPYGGVPSKPQWDKAQIETVHHPENPESYVFSRECKMLEPGLFILEIPSSSARSHPNLKVTVTRSLQFPYEGEVMVHLTEKVIAEGEVALTLKAQRKFTRRIARILVHKETGKPIANSRVVLMKQNVQGSKGAEQTRTDSEGFFQFLIWDDYEYYLKAGGVSDRFGVVNDPELRSIHWVPPSTK